MDQEPVKAGENEGGPSWADWALGFPARRPWLVIAVAMGIMLASIAGMTRLRASTDIGSMLARGDASAEAMAEIVERYGFVDEMFVLVSVEEAAGAKPQAGMGEVGVNLGERAKPRAAEGVAALKGYARRFEAAVRGDADAGLMMRSVSWSASPQYRQFTENVLIPSEVFYLTDEEFATLRERVAPDTMAALIKSAEAKLHAPGPVADGLAQLAVRDPLGLHEFMLSRLQQQRGAMATYEGGEAFITPDGSMLMIRVAGVKDVSDLEFAKDFTAALSDVIEKTEPNADGVPLHVELTGAYAIAAQSERAIRGDVTFNVCAAALLLPLLFLLTYRSAWGWPLAMVPLAWGIAVGFGVYALIGTQITPLTGAAGAAIAGLSVGYCIHYLSQYMTNLAESVRAKPQALSRVDLEAVTVLTAKMIGLSIGSACATPVLAFVAIGFSHVRAVREFAVLAGLGLVFVAVGVFSVLPALLALTVRSGRHAGGAMSMRFSVERVIKSIAARSTIWLSTSGVVVCAAVAFVLARPAGPFTFESDLAMMHPRPNPPLDAQQRMAEGFGSDIGSLMILLRVPDSPNASARLVSLAHEVDRRLNTPAVRDAHVRGTLGLATLLPDPVLTEHRLAQLKSIDAPQIAHSLASAIGHSETLEPKAYEGYARFVEKLLTPPAPPALDSLRGYDELTGSMLPKNAFAGTNKSTPAAPITQAVTMVWMTQPMRGQEERDAAIGAIRQSLDGLDGVALTGLSVLGHDTEKAVLGDLTRQLSIAALLVFLWMLAAFRSLKETLLALLPAAGTLAVLLAVMDVAGQRFNLVNLITLPMLVGIGVDYGIFLVCAVRTHRMAQRMGWPGAERTLVERFAVDGHALLMTTATTMLGLGTLAFTSVPAIQSLGRAAGLAMAVCLVLTMLMLMPMLVLRERGRLKRESKS